MKKLLPILSFISFILYALVDFIKNALETYFRVQLMNGIGNFSNQVYLIDTHICQTILLSVGIISLIVFVAPFLAKKLRSKTN